MYLCGTTGWPWASFGYRDNQGHEIGKMFLRRVGIRIQTRCTYCIKFSSPSPCNLLNKSGLLSYKVNKDTDGISGMSSNIAHPSIVLPISWGV